MRWWWGWWIVLALLIPALGLADDFEEPHASNGLSEEEAVVVPEGNDSVRAPDFLQALETVQERTELFDNGPEAEPEAVSGPAGAGELPFTLLGLDADRDQDGVSDADERLLGTDGARADSDGDTYSDGLEVVRGYNPLLASPGDKVAWRLVPQKAEDETFTVTGVRLVREADEELLVVTGTGPEGAVVRLVVLSGEARVWVSRTDATGRFLYVSADTLELGEHQVWAVRPTVDGALPTGEPYVFRRTDGGIERSLAVTPAAEAETTGLVPAWVERRLLPGVVVAGVVVASAAVLFYFRRAGQIRRRQAAMREGLRKLS